MSQKNYEQFLVTKAIYDSGIMEKKKLKPSTGLTLYALSCHYNHRNKYIFPSQETMAKLTGRGRGSINSGINELVKKGLVIKLDKEISGRYKPTLRYQFLDEFFKIIDPYVGKVKSQQHRANNQSTVKKGNVASFNSQAEYDDEEEEESF